MLADMSSEPRVRYEERWEVNLYHLESKFPN